MGLKIKFLQTLTYQKTPPGEPDGVCVFQNS
jgi:hypothetical protein